MWLYLGISSALFLGVYDVFKKWSVKDNAVPEVLFYSTCFGAMLTLPVFVLSRFLPGTMMSAALYAGLPTASEHLCIIAKTVLVSISWISAYIALKHLPISIVSPIRASAPLWTLVGAVFFFGEALRPLHWAGILVTFISYYLFSIIGKKEGIRFSRNKHVTLVFVATLTGALSALYDKYLLHNMDIPPITLQVWFSFYLVAATGIIWGIMRRGAAASERFEWRFSIPLIGVFLIIADYLYFRALSHPAALIAVLSVIRRSSVVISFVFGGILFKERNKRIKTIPLTGVLVGICLLLIGK